MFKALEKYSGVFKIELIDFFQSKWDVIFGFLFLGIVIFVFYQLWALGFAQKAIPGYSLAKLVFYVAIAESVTISTIRIYKIIDDDLKKGLLTNYLSKPVNYVFFQFSRALGKSAITLFINLALTLAFCFLLFGFFPFSLLEFAAVIFASIFCLCLLVLVGVFFGLLGFYTEDSSAFYFVYSKAIYIFGGLVFPLDLYPQWLKSISDFLPFKWAVFAAGKLAISFSTDFFIEVLLMQLFWIAVFAGLCLFVFSRISRKVFINGG
ncbi:MAG: hypothetical protein Q7R70_04270 [Candidatus Diapherotrites archaeon]|nr:hypothetical protein [Candidatus Diapherotrites archaeon]